MLHSMVVSTLPGAEGELWSGGSCPGSVCAVLRPEKEGTGLVQEGRRGRLPYMDHRRQEVWWGQDLGRACRDDGFYGIPEGSVWKARPKDSSVHLGEGGRFRFAGKPILIPMPPTHPEINAILLLHSSIAPFRRHTSLTQEL